MRATNFHSKARIAGHPIHPMLVHFPIALFIGGVISFLAFLAVDDLFWYRAAAVAFLAGAAFAVLAAIPGMIDLFGGIRRSSPAFRTGVKHMGLNLVAVVLYTAAGVLMYRSYVAETEGALRNLDVALPLVLSLIGAVVLTVSGALGSKLAYKYHVGQHVDEGVIDDETVDTDVPLIQPTMQGRSGTADYRPHV